VNDSIHNQTASEERDRVLTQDERVFRAALLASAQDLDVPSPELEHELRIRFGHERGLLARRWLGPRQSRPIAVACVGLAAGAALVVALGERHRETQVKAEPETPVLSIKSATVALAAEAPEPARAVGIVEPQTVSPPAVTRASASRLAATAGVAAAVAEPRVIVWDGDTHGNGAHGWAAPTDMPKTRSSVKDSPSVGFAGTTGIEWHGEGPEWTGFGWNWFSWWPANAGTDISGYERLVFKLRAVAAKPTDLPALESLAVSLISSQGDGKKCTGSVDLAKYAPSDLLDSKWHPLSIPLKDMFAGEKADGFDRKTAWEFRLGEWSPISRSFTIFIDDIGFEKDNAKGSAGKRKGR
jgi:hypothetical protein